MSAVAGKVPGAVADGIYELEERAAFLYAACAALAEKPDAAGLLNKKSLQGLAWWTLDLEGRLRELAVAVGEPASLTDSDSGFVG